MNILFVEDEPDTREVTAELMRVMGHQVVDVGNANAALRLLRSDVPIDVLVCDIGLPGMDGDLLAAEARCLRSELRVVFTTGQNFQQAAKDPFPVVLIKPYSPDELEGALRNGVGRP